MLKVEILVQEIAGGWTALDTYGDAPAMVFQINDLNELADRQAAYSQSIRLPITPTNNRVFGYANVFEAHSRVPYQIRRVVVYVDGVEIVPPAFRLELRSVSTDYHCQIVSDVRGLFATLAETPFSNLTLPPFLWELEDTTVNYTGSTEIRKWIQTANKYFTYLSEEQSWAVNGSQGKFFKVGGERGDNADPKREFEWFAAIRPYYPVLDIAHMIFMDQGYTLNTNVSSMPGYVKHYFSLCNMVPQPDSFDTLQGSAVGTAKSYAGIPPKPLPIFDYLTVNNVPYGGVDTMSFANPYVEGEPLLPTITMVRYSCPGCYTLKVRIVPIVTGSAGNGRLRFRAAKYAKYIDKGKSYGTDFEIITETEPEGLLINQIPLDGWETDKFELAVGEDVHVEAYLMEGNGTTTYNCRIEYVYDYADHTQVGPGCKVYPALSTDFKTQNDFIKLFIQLYGLFITVDEDTRTVHAMTFQTLMDNVETGRYVDWTRKVDMNTAAETGFRVGSYAQVNKIGAQEHAQMISKVDSGSIAVDNRNLDATKDLFTLPMQSSFEAKVYFDNYKTPLSDVYMECGCALTNADGRAYMVHGITTGGYWLHYIYKLAKLKTHIVAFETYVDQTGDINATYIYRYARNTVNLACPARFGRAVKIQGIIDTYYSALRDYILSPARIIELKVKLTPGDIRELDLLKPVFLGQYGDYFYIQKISNYVAGELTTVNLICLNTAK